MSSTGVTLRWQPMLLRSILLMGLTAAGAACGVAEEADPTPEPAGSCKLALPSGADDALAIRAALTAEGEYVVEQQITPLMALWAEESRIADAKNTPDDTSDDQQWIEKDAIRHRYVRTVFPGAPSAIQPADLEIAIEGERATVVATTQVGQEVAPAGDRWTLIKQGECWYLESLTYNLEAAE